MATFESLFSSLREFPSQTPRRDLLPGLRRPPLLWSLLFPFLFLSLFPLALPLMMFLMPDTNRSYSEKATAVVLQREELTVPTQDEHSFLKYRFRVGGQTITSNVLVNNNHYYEQDLRTLKVGQTFQVAYDPTNHKHYGPATRQVDRESMWGLVAVAMIFFPLFGFLMLAPFLLAQFRSWLLARRLYSQGALAQGHVIFVHDGTMAFFNQKAGSNQVVYTFTDQNGVEHQGYSGVSNEWLVAQWHPESPVVVAYDVKKPRRNVIMDAFSAARR